jgi:TonB family protein
VEDTVALDAARVPFAQYLNDLHVRIHPIFADELLAAMNETRGPWPQSLRTVLALVIDQKTGKLKRVGVVEASGVTAFDIAALATIDRALPFKPVPEAIASPDGNVYIQWEFHPDPVDACTTRNARPLILKSAP